VLFAKETRSVDQVPEERLDGERPAAKLAQHYAQN